MHIRKGRLPSVQDLSRSCEYDPPGPKGGRKRKQAHKERHRTIRKQEQQTQATKCIIDTVPDSAIDMYLWTGSDDVDLEFSIAMTEGSMILSPSTSSSRLLDEPLGLVPPIMNVSGDSNDLTLLPLDKPKDRQDNKDSPSFTTLKRCNPAETILPIRDPPFVSTIASSSPSSSPQLVTHGVPMAATQNHTPRLPQPQLCQCLSKTVLLIDELESEQNDAFACSSTTNTYGLDTWLALMRESLRYVEGMFSCAQCVCKPENRTILTLLTDRTMASCACERHVDMNLAARAAGEPRSHHNQLRRSRGRLSVRGQLLGQNADPAAAEGAASLHEPHEGGVGDVAGVCRLGRFVLQDHRDGEAYYRSGRPIESVVHTTFA